MNNFLTNFNFFFFRPDKCDNGTDCSRAQWVNDTAPELVKTRPVRKDTVVVPPGGYAVVRLITLNPGMWHLHCHMSHHLFYGMSMVLHNEGDVLPPPPGFPLCGNFDVEDDYIARARAKYQQLLMP